MFYFSVGFMSIVTPRCFLNISFRNSQCFFDAVGVTLVPGYLFRAKSIKQTIAYLFHACGMEQVPRLVAFVGVAFAEVGFV